MKYRITLEVDTDDLPNLQGGIKGMMHGLLVDMADSMYLRHTDPANEFHGSKDDEDGVILSQIAVAGRRMIDSMKIEEIGNV